MNDVTVFFVKPHIIQKREEIFEYLTNHIENPEDFNIFFRKRFEDTPKQFWRDFYSHMKETYPTELENMAVQFENYKKGIDLALIRGKDIAKRVKKITGETLYKKNPDWTIRGHFGPYKLPNTIVHASDPEQVEKDIDVIKRYFPIHICL